MGFATPPRYCRDSSAARRPSSASPRAARRALRRSCVANRSSMIAIQRSSSARDIRAGSSTMVRSPSRYADTVRRRRALRRTSTEPTGTSLPVTATRAPYRRCATPARHHAQARSHRRRSHWRRRPDAADATAEQVADAWPDRPKAADFFPSTARVAIGAGGSAVDFGRCVGVHTPIPPRPQEHSCASPPRPQPCPQAGVLRVGGALTARSAAS